MKISDLLNEEYPPQSKSSQTAQSIGRQIFQRAQKEAYKAGKANNTKFIKQLADKVVNRFTSNILQAVDDEIKYSQAQSVPQDEPHRGRWTGM